MNSLVGRTRKPYVLEVEKEFQKRVMNIITMKKSGNRDQFWI